MVPLHTAHTQTKLTRCAEVRLVLVYGKGASDWEGPEGGASGGLVTLYVLMRVLGGWRSSFRAMEPSVLSGSACLLASIMSGRVPFLYKCINATGLYWGCAGPAKEGERFHFDGAA